MPRITTAGWEVRPAPGATSCFTSSVVLSDVLLSDVLLSDVALPDGLLSVATLDDATRWLAVIAARGIVSASGSWDEAEDPLVPSSHAIGSSKSSDAPAAT